MKNKELSNNKKVYINLIASFISYIITFGISFFLSPYIVKTIGVEAYGFVTLANNFINYASLITIAVNALAGRFITISIQKGNNEEANKYYTSVFIANVFLSFIMLVVAIIVWIYLEKIINIPNAILWDVKILFATLFINCIVNTVGSVFSVAIFAKNKLYLGSIRNIEGSIARAVILVLFFVFLSPRVYYLGITTLIITIYIVAFNIYYTKKLTPFLKINKSYFDIKAVIELTTSGVWNLITRLGQILADGLDLLITNLFIDPTAMGVLSLAKTIPNIITGIISAMVASFSPNFTILYAENKIDELNKAIKQSMKIMGILCNLPIIVLIVCGERFFEIWQPTQDAKQLQILSILTCAGLIVNGGINCIYNIFTVVNKLKFNSLVLLFSSMISIVTTFFCIKYTNLGIYAVAGVSTVIMIIKNITLIVPYSAKCLKLKWYTFYPDVIYPILFVCISTLICNFIDKNISITGIIGLLLSAIITVFISVFIGLFVILRKSDRNIIIQKVIRKVK